MTPPIVTKSLEELYDFSDEHNALQRIIEESYLDDEWQEDPTNCVRKLYRFLCNDIESPRGESLVEDKAFMIQTMCDDILHYRTAFLLNNSHRGNTNGE